MKTVGPLVRIACGSAFLFDDCTPLRHNDDTLNNLSIHSLPESITMKNFLTTAAIAFLIAIFLPSSDSEGQVNMRMILDQIIRNQNANQNQNRGNAQPPVVRRSPSPTPTVRQVPRGIPPRSIPGQQPRVQNYVLTSGGVNSKATFDGSKLMIYADGIGYRYSRLPKFDTPDGKYLGFANQQLDKCIRFPVNGGSRLQVEGPGNSWNWSQMKVRKSAQPVAVGDIYAQVDLIAVKVQDQSRQLAGFANQYCRNSPYFGQLVVDSSAMLKQSMHMHELCDSRGDLKLFRKDLAVLDTSFQHLEETFGLIEADARRGQGRGLGPQVRQCINQTGANIQLLQGIVGKVSQPVVKPVVIKGPPFGTCSNIDPLVHQLEDAVNELLLDMHYNYCDNPKFDSAYKKTYRLLVAAQEVHDAGEKNQRKRIRRALKGLDALTCQLQEEFKSWTCQPQYRCGIGTLRQKLSTVQWILLDLMHDAGVEPAELRYLAGRNLVAPPLNVPPLPR